MCRSGPCGSAGRVGMWAQVQTPKVCDPGLIPRRAAVAWGERSRWRGHHGWVGDMSLPCFVPTSSHCSRYMLYSVCMDSCVMFNHYGFLVCWGDG